MFGWDDNDVLRFYPAVCGLDPSGVWIDDGQNVAVLEHARHIVAGWISIESRGAVAPQMSC